ncbi:MAG: hypothetical protein ACE5H2_06095 [Terriglobia bacterium]
MEPWLIVFVGLTALAVLLQAGVLTATYLQLRRMSNEMSELRQRYNDRLDPLLTHLNDILRTVQVSSQRIMDDVTTITKTTRNQVEKFDRVSDELSDRVRLQIIRLDELLTRTMSAVEQAGEKVERSLTGPMREAVAVVHGVKTALDILTQRRKRGGQAAAEEELFI